MTETVERIFQLMEQRNLSAYRLSHETGISQARFRVEDRKSTRSRTRWRFWRIILGYRWIICWGGRGRLRTGATGCRGTTRWGR
ncbi:MAG: hypothetical protein ACLUO4_09495 [Christensenellales bacterium]